jgi:hypothetical protein
MAMAASRRVSQRFHHGDGPMPSPRNAPMRNGSSDSAWLTIETMKFHYPIPLPGGGKLVTFHAATTNR